MIELNDGYTYFTHKGKDQTDWLDWKVILIDDNTGLAQAWKRPSSSGFNSNSSINYMEDPNNPWIDFQCKLIPDYMSPDSPTLIPNNRLNTVRAFINEYKLNSARKKLTDAQKAEVGMADGRTRKIGNSPSIFVNIGNDLKHILITNGISMGPYIRTLIENDLRAKGLIE